MILGVILSFIRKSRQPQNSYDSIYNKNIKQVTITLKTQNNNLTLDTISVFCVMLLKISLFSVQAC